MRTKSRPGALQGGPPTPLRSDPEVQAGIDKCLLLAAGDPEQLNLLRLNTTLQQIQQVSLAGAGLVGSTVLPALRHAHAGLAVAFFGHVRASVDHDYERPAHNHQA